MKPSEIQQLWEQVDTNIPRMLKTWIVKMAKEAEPEGSSVAQACAEYIHNPSQKNLEDLIIDSWGTKEFPMPLTKAIEAGWAKWSGSFVPVGKALSSVSGKPPLDKFWTVEKFIGKESYSWYKAIGKI